MATFKSGDRVRCINTEGLNAPGWTNPVYGGIYTIDYVYPDDTVTLAEISMAAVNFNLILHGLVPEAAFYAWHFVKIEDDVTHCEEEEMVEEEVLV